MKRGEVWVVNFNPTRGHEIGKIRPAVVIQADELGPEITPIVVVLPLTTRVYSTYRHWRITLPARDRLLKASQVVIDQPRSIDRKRIGEGPLTALTHAELAAVEKSLRGVLGML
jgi:mRNA interferase MazF